MISDFQTENAKSKQLQKKERAKMEQTDGLIRIDKKVNQGDDFQMDSQEGTGTKELEEKPTEEIIEVNKPKISEEELFVSNLKKNLVK